MSASGKTLTVAERKLIKYITAAGFFIPCIVDPALYTLNVSHSKTFSPKEKKLMIQQSWVHNGFNLLLEGVSYIGFALGASWLFKNKPNVSLIEEAAPIIGVCVFKSLFRPFAMFHAALKLENKPGKNQNPSNAIILPAHSPSQPTTPTLYPHSPTLIQPIRTFSPLMRSQNPLVLR